MCLIPSAKVSKQSGAVVSFFFLPPSKNMLINLIGKSPYLLPLRHTLASPVILIRNKWWLA